MGGPSLQLAAAHNTLGCLSYYGLKNRTRLKVYTFHEPYFGQLEGWTVQPLPRYGVKKVVSLGDPIGA